jgi:hypothetical protein
MRNDTTIDLSNHYSGGYFLVRADKPDWPQLKSELLPERLVSLSSCICPILKVHWGWKTGNIQSAQEFGIPEDRLDEFVQWCSTEWRTEMDVSSMFYSTDAARRFIRRFLPDTSDLFLIGAGLPREVEEVNWSEEAAGRVDGVEKRIEQHLPMESGGIALGYEVVAYTHTDFDCSWLCSYLHSEAYDLFGIHPNRYGLINDYEQAKRVWKWTDERTRQGKKTRHEPYDFWLLVSYPLKETA